MTDPKQALPEGVALTSINITAASPEVIQRVCQEISNRVMAAIPDASFTKIAQEVLTEGELFIERRPSSWSSDTKLYYEMNKTVRGEIAKELTQRVAKFVDATLASEEFAKVATNVATAVIKDIVTNYLPGLVALAFSARLTQAWSVPAPTLEQYTVSELQLQDLREWAQKLQDKLGHEGLRL
jgi:hypothetical protein